MNRLSKDAVFVWSDRDAEGRNLYTRFRRKFMLSSEPDAAVIGIFADSHYQLWINGRFIALGPARFDPKTPEYDEWDILPYLSAGPNIIAVHVQHVGHHTFKHIPAKAGLACMGGITVGGVERISFATGEDSGWMCTPDPAYRRYTGKASFALPARQVALLTSAEEGWREADYDDSAWSEAVAVSDRQIWGTLQPRSIPQLQRIETVPKEVRLMPLTEQEQLYSFEVPAPHNSWFEEDKTWSGFIAFAAWIFSPLDQTVTAGTFYGDYWINGEKSEGIVPAANKSMRYNRRWHLRTGWNSLFGTVTAYQDIIQVYLSLPDGKGLFLSAERNMESPYAWKHTPIMTADAQARWRSRNQLPLDPDEPLEEAGGWILVRRDDPAQNPCMESGWQNYGEPFEGGSLVDLSDRTFGVLDYPSGFALLLDFGSTSLLLPRIRFEGVQGAIIDITYSEHLQADGLHLKQEHYYGLGDRLICQADAVDWQPMEPRGCKYLLVTVRHIRSDVRLTSLCAESIHYPAVQQGSLKTDDSLLNAIWEIGRRTLSVNMEDAYVDCVTRERGMYGRDTIIQYHVNLAVYGDQLLMRRCLQLFGQSADPSGKFRACYPTNTEYTIADFALNMIEGYWVYYEQTGDSDLLRAYWPAMQTNLNWFHELSAEREDGLLDADWPQKRGIITPYGGFHGDLAVGADHMAKNGVHCVFSCTYVIALRCAGYIAKVLGDAQAAGEINQRVEKLKTSINSAFWHEEKGAFADNTEGKTFSPHANLFAVRAGIVDERRKPMVKKHVARELKSLILSGNDPTQGVMAAPDFMFYLLDGLYQLDMEETAERLIKEGWGWFLAAGLSTCPEYFRTDLSLCHAWSAHPTYYLSKYVLGVHYPEPANPDLVFISPKTCYVGQAEGSYPHVRGTIQIKWRMENGRRIYEQVEGPEGVEIHINDPLA